MGVGASFFNLFNHPNFDQPNTDIGTPSDLWADHRDRKRANQHFGGRVEREHSAAADSAYRPHNFLRSKATSPGHLASLGVNSGLFKNSRSSKYCRSC